VGASVLEVDVEVLDVDAAGSASPMSLLHAATVPTRSATATRRRANETGRAGGVRVTPHSLTDRAVQLKSWCEAVTMLEPIRHARRADVTAMIAIAEEGDAPGVDGGYLDFVAAQGRLLVACESGDDALVVGFAGSIPVGGAAMVTDLFVADTHRGTGVGGTLLAAVTDGFERRMTCSSAHPAARAAYARAGLEPCWPVLVLHGPATGRGAPLPAGEWRHDRHELVTYYSSMGVGDEQVGHHRRAARPDEPHRVLRMVSEQPEVDVAHVLASLPEGDTVEWCVPAPSPAAAWLLEHGFAVVDDDLFCATPGMHLVPQLVALHRGLL
jgi:GNAT superfamily N-acetyltransferase